MLRSVVSIFDRKGVEYRSLWLANSDAAAVRDFEVAIVQDNGRTLLSQYPGDFCLMKVGEFDTETGALSVQTPVVLHEAASVAVRASQQLELVDEIAEAEAEDAS